MKILIVWELGSNWGHLATLLPLAARLRDAGHDVMFAVRGLDGDLSPLQRSGFDYIASPIAIAPLQKLHHLPVRGYADVLARCGFSDVQTLTQLTRAWQGLLRLVKPDLVICKYAPLAEFATWTCPALAIGTGFELPPLSQPLPLYHTVRHPASDESEDTERQILQAMRETSMVCGFPAPAFAGEGFAHVSRACLSWPALDHFGTRVDLQYFHPIDELPSSRAALSLFPQAWLDAEKPICFVYLRSESTWLRDFLTAAMARFPQRRWLVVNPGLSLPQCHALSSAQVRVVNEPVDWTSCEIAATTGAVDSVICHGGHGMVSQALAKGLRLVILPQQTEQLLLAHRVVMAQPATAGVVVLGPRTQPLDLVRAFERSMQLVAPVSPCTTDACYNTSAITSLMQRIEDIVQPIRGMEGSDVQPA